MRTIYGHTIIAREIDGFKVVLRGGNMCMNGVDASGAPIDPISLSPIPVNRLVRITAPNGKFYCFDSKTLLAWLDLYTTNPATGLVFTREEGMEIVNSLRNNFTWFNGARSPFSHPPIFAAAVGEAKPWPRGLARIYMGL